MNLLPATRTENFPFGRMVSQGGRWELGLVPMLFGVRVRAGLVGDDWALVDYCGGADPVFVLELLATMYAIFSALPEDISTGDLEALMPTYQRRPIDRDPCWQKLQELSARLKTEKGAPCRGAREITDHHQ